MKQRNLQMEKMNCKLHSHHLDPVQRECEKNFFSFGRTCLDASPSPFSTAL